jgi:hypothetical protein
MFKKLLICFLYMMHVNSSSAQDSLNINNLRISNWQLVYSIGAGASHLNGNLTQYFQSNLFVLPIGMAIRFKRHHVIMDLSGDLFFNHFLLKSLDDNGILRPAGLPLDFTWLQVAYGYSVLDNNKWRITPYLGFGGLEVIEIEPDLKTYPSTKNILRRKSYDWSGGVCIDYKISVKVEVTPPYNYGAQLEHGFQARFGAMPVNYQPDLKGWGMMGSISYYFGLRMARK